MLTAPHSLSRLAARQQPARCMPQAAPLLQPNTQRSCGRCVQVIAATGGSSWYQQSPGSKSSSSSTGPSSSSSQRQRSRHYYDSTPRQKSRQPNSGNKPSTSQPQSSHLEDDYEDDLPDAEGWEVPRELSAAEQLADAVAARFASGASGSGGIAGLNLSRWQEEKLLLAAAGSKKKMQVQALAADLGLDRTEVLAWVAAFRAKPKQEQAKLLAPLQQQIQQQQQRQQQQQQQQQKEPPAAVTPPALSSSSTGDVPRSATTPAAAVLPFSAPNPNTGYLPFAARRAGGAPKGKRLPAEVLRTLEGVYDRSPWPSKEVVAGLYDLHRLPRDVVLDWFTARRDLDGVPHNPRQAKLARTAQQAAAAATQPQQPQQQQQQAKSLQQGGSDQAAAAAASRAVSRLTAKELASLRSALPSPRKFKGQQLAEELGIKTVKGGKGSTPQLEIAGVTFVARDGAAAWRGAWRRRRATKGLPAQRLDFQKWFL